MPSFGASYPPPPSKTSRAPGSLTGRLRAEAHRARALDILHDRLSRVTLSTGAISPMLVFKRLVAWALSACAIAGSGGPALAGLGQPSPWQVGFQQSPSPVMDKIAS